MNLNFMHGYHITPKQATQLIIQRKNLYEVQGIEFKDIYQLVKDLFEDLNIYYTDCEVWEMFFEPSMCY